MGNSKFLAEGLSLVVVLLAAVCSPGGVANSGLGNPVGPATVPQSGIQSGLVRSPNPVDNGGSMGNMIITGNVEAGKQFRGRIPYYSTTDFRAPLGSTSLDSFLRYSAGSQDDAGLTEAYRPFYSPTGTVSTIRLGQPTSGLSWPASTKIRTNAELSWSGLPDDELQDIPAAQNPLAGRVGDSFDVLPVRSRPMAKTPQELEKLISADLERTATSQSLSSSLQGQAPSERSEESRLRSPDASPSAQQGESLTSAQYREQMEQIQQELKRLSDEAAELRQSVQTLSGQENRGTIEEQRPPRLLVEDKGGGQSDRVLHPGLQDVTEQFNRKVSPAEVRAKLDSLLASASQQQTKQSPPELSQDTAVTQELSGVGPLVRQTDNGLVSDQQLMTRGTADEQAAARLADRNSPDSAGVNLSPQQRGLPGSTSLTALQEVNKLSAQELSAEAKRILGGHEDYNTYSANKFEQYSSAGQEYLKQGKYYRAADAFTLASIYKSGPPGSLRQRQAAALVYAGKSLALFAAGEYISSALFLSRALQADQSSVVNCQLSIPKDSLNSRIADVEECLRACRKAGYQTGSVGELQFLLSYIYLRTARLSEAKRALDEAYKMLPDSPAVMAVKDAIDQAIARQRINN